MERREAVRNMALLLGGTISATTLGVLFDSCSPSQKNNKELFSKDQEGLITEISDTIIPKTTSPGAKEAGVGAFVAMMINECYDEDAQSTFVKGLEDVEELSDDKFGKPFVKLAADQRYVVLREIADKTVKLKEEDKKKADEAKQKNQEAPEKKKVHFFQLIRELTLLGYFTSEIGATQALAYLPVPGKYEGCTDLTDGQKTWAL